MELGLTPTAPHDPPQPAGLFRRLWAAFIDDAILAAIGLAIAFPLGDTLASFGAGGRLLGLAIALAYFGLLGGAPGDGQTVGKRVARIRVVDATGAPLPVGRALLRALLLALPWFLNGLPLRATFLLTPLAGPIVGALLSMIVFGLGGAILLTLVFNRTTRQGAHDLVVRSFVVMDGPEVAMGGARASRRMTGAAIAWLAVVAVASVGGAAFAMIRGPWPALEVPAAVARRVEALPGVLSAAVVSNTMYAAQGRRWTELVVNARTSDAREDLAPAVARAALSVPGADAHDAIRIQLQHGADLGIAHWIVSRGDVRAPADWRRDTQQP